jgi:hypothetical protein
VKKSPGTHFRPVVSCLAAFALVMGNPMAQKVLGKREEIIPSYRQSDEMRASKKLHVRGDV